MDALFNPHSFIAVLFGLIAAHFICDYAFQPTAMYIGKNQLKGEPYAGINWWYWLTAHSMSHAVAVALVTRNVYLGLAEFVAHWAIDWAHSKKYIGLHFEQALHLFCKLTWALIILVLFVTSF